MTFAISTSYGPAFLVRQCMLTGKYRQAYVFKGFFGRLVHFDFVMMGPLRNRFSAPKKMFSATVIPEIVPCSCTIHSYPGAGRLDHRPRLMPFPLKYISPLLAG
jgi:hypothetical protein